MEYAGDLSENQRRLVPELRKFEKSIDEDDCYPKEGRAMMYTCMAHDWYQLDMEEEGSRLLLKAEAACPGYFAGPVVQHQKENPNFDQLIKNLTIELIGLVTNSLRNK